MNTKLFLVLFTGLVAAGPAKAQNFLTLDAAVERSFQNNPALKQYNEKINEADGNVFQSRAALFPKVNVVADAQTLKDAANKSTARFDGSTYNNYSVLLSASQPLFAWGIFSAINAPKKDREIRQLDVEIQQRELSSQVIHSFYKLLLNQRFVEILRHTEDIQKESLSTAQRRQRIGRGQLLDVLQVKTQLALLAPKIAKAINDASLASAELVNLMGDTELKQLHVVGNLDVVPLMEINKEIDFKNFNLPEYKKVFANQERVQALRSAALGKNYPTLSAIGTWGRSATIKSDLWDAHSTAWMVGLELNIPLFSGLSSLGERQVFASQLAQLQFEQKSLENTLALNQVRGLKNLELAQANISSSVSAFNLAEDSMKEAKRNFQFANIDFLQYLSVQQAYLEAASSLDQAKYTYIDSLVNYFISSGQNLTKLIDLLRGQKL